MNGSELVVNIKNNVNTYTYLYFIHARKLKFLIIHILHKKYDIISHGICQVT